MTQWMGCPYRDALGEPGKGLHSTRIFGLAAFDLLATFLVALLIGTAFGSKSLWLDVFVFAVLVGIGAIVHHMLCIKTPLNAWF